MYIQLVLGQKVPEYIYIKCDMTLLAREIKKRGPVTLGFIYVAVAGSYNPWIQYMMDV